MIDRTIHKDITKKIGQGKAIIVIGPRQVGKTTLITNIVKEFSDVLSLNADNQDVRILFGATSSTQLEKSLEERKQS